MKKAWICICSVPVCMLGLPLLAFRLVSGMEAVGLLLLFVFALYPALFVGYGVLTGLEPKRMWPVPLLAAVLFPPCFWLAVGEVVWVFYLYAALYLGFAVLSATPVALVRYVRSLKGRN